MTSNTALTIFTALIGAGLLAYLKELIVWLTKRRAATTPEAKIVTSLEEATRTIAILRATRDDLQNENDTLRATLKDERDYHAQDRIEWRTREGELRQLCIRCQRTLSESGRVSDIIDS